jgi:hypothetical protein
MSTALFWRASESCPSRLRHGEEATFYHGTAGVAHSKSRGLVVTRVVVAATVSASLSLARQPPIARGCAAVPTRLDFVDRVAVVLVRLGASFAKK